jgi:hypothetical protein
VPTQAGERNSDSFSHWIAAEARILKKDNKRVYASDLHLLRSFKAVLATQLAANPVKTDNTAELLAASERLELVRLSVREFFPTTPDRGGLTG